MKGTDIFVVLILVAVVLAFLFCAPLAAFYADANAQHGYLVAFVKFAILATFGEMLAARIRCGAYLPAQFGLLPRAVVWGLIGVTINFFFKVFAQGVPPALESLGLLDAKEAFAQGALTPTLIFTAFCISVVMNVVYAPVMMLMHKVTDLHILEYHGSVKALLRPIKMKEIVSQRVDWNYMWSFVYKRTIPLFWIPAHTISFILPASYRVLFAALLGIALGLILSVATRKK